MKLLDNLGENIIYSNDNEYLKSIIENGIPVNPIINFPNLDNKNVTSISFKIKRILKTIKSNSYTIPKFWKKKVYILDESRIENTLNHLKAEYKGQIFPISFFDYYNNQKSTISNIETNNITKLVDSIVLDLKKIAMKHSLTFNLNKISFLKKHTKKIFLK